MDLHDYMYPVGTHLWRNGVRFTFKYFSDTRQHAWHAGSLAHEVRVMRWRNEIRYYASGISFKDLNTALAYAVEHKAKLVKAASDMVREYVQARIDLESEMDREDG